MGGCCHTPADQSESSSKPSGALRPPLLRWRQLQLHFDPLPKPQQPAQAVASEDAKAAKEEDAGEATQQEDQHEKKEDKDEEKDFNHEEKEDTHEEKTDSNHQESQDGSASASGSQDQEPIARQKSSSEPGLNCSGESWWCRWERMSSPEIAQAQEAPQALCLRVGMCQWPTKDHQTPMPSPMSTLE